MWTRERGARLALTGEEKRISNFPVFLFLLFWTFLACLRIKYTHELSDKFLRFKGV